jgi:hypothetical protein
MRGIQVEERLDKFTLECIKNGCKFLDRRTEVIKCYDEKAQVTSL